MKKEYEEQYHRLEENHWWFRGRRDIVRSLVVGAASDRNCRILEMGCSGGPLIQGLQTDGFTNITGIDISPDAIELCKKRGLLDVHVMDAQKLSFADGQFDVITASDVLEHLSNPSEALREWSRILKPGGVLILFVPAFQFLWSHHDEVNKHFCRYRRGDVVRRLRSAGFKVERSSYWNLALFFPVAAVRFFRRCLPKKNEMDGKGDIFGVPKLLNNALTWLLQFENSCLRLGVFFPVGVSVMAIGRKPNASS